MTEPAAKTEEAISSSSSTSAANDNVPATDQSDQSAQEAITSIMSNATAASVESRQVLALRTNDTTTTLTNPWNVSPAVTSSQSEASETRVPKEPDNKIDLVAAAAEPSTMVGIKRSNSNPALLPQQAQQWHPQQPQQEEPSIPQTFSLPVSAMNYTPAQGEPNKEAEDTKEVNHVRFSDSTAAPDSVPPTPTNNNKNSHTHLTVDTSDLQALNSSGSVSTDYQEGGRLWQAALEEAEKRNEILANKKKTRNRITESIMERTRSRADPNALITTSSTATPIGAGKPSSTMVSLGGDHESSFILSTALAKKRVRVVQLLLIGLVGLLLGLLGNFFVSTSCHFASVSITVGQNEQTFDFHFGLWKYSPIDSVFQGYPYCYKYDQNYAAEAPLVARAANITALLAGLISLSVLWLYLIFGTTNKRRWKWAVRMAIFAGLIQLGTLYFFLGTLCQEYSCQLGLGAYLSMFTSVVWFVLAMEMQYHMPVAIYASSGGSGMAGPAALEEPHALVAQMEMTSCMGDVTREYVTRVTGKDKDMDNLQNLSRAQQQQQRRTRPSPCGLYSPTNACGFYNGGNYIPSPTKGTYQAPDPTLLEEALATPSSRNQ
ncbi:expressed unknown protein [Seminavis robusta]|uniref:Uncharacterized protein n=1 Tax=Seminavis robusta TaxID=568900 RepID=A0A9N8DUU3_9STRA|nr:expressed unknown protein [Seminavis robusta]|eukprot:Sro388_g132400.1 n/a (603) ;mRNA; f:47701-49613